MFCKSVCLASYYVDSFDSLVSDWKFKNMSVYGLVVQTLIRLAWAGFGFFPGRTMAASCVRILPHSLHSVFRLCCTFDHLVSPIPVPSREELDGRV